MNIKNLQSFMASLPAVPETVVIRGGRGMGIVTSLVDSYLHGGLGRSTRYISLRDMLPEDFLGLPCYTDIPNEVLMAPGAMFSEALSNDENLLILDNIDSCPIEIQEIVFCMARYRMVGKAALPDNCRVILLDYSNTGYEAMSAGWQNIMDHCHSITID